MWLVCVIAIDDCFDKFRLLLLLLVSVFSHRKCNEFLQSLNGMSFVCVCAMSMTESRIFFWRRNRLVHAFEFGKLISTWKQEKSSVD